MTDPATSPESPLSTAAIRSALERHPDAAVLVLPRADGQYSGVAADVLGLLEEAGVAADYASDPMATGVHIEKSADIVLPFLLIIAQAIGTAGNVSTTIDGIITTIRWFTQRRPGAIVQLNVGVTRRPDGAEIRKLEMTIGPGGLDERSERAVRNAIDRMVF